MHTSAAIFSLKNSFLRVKNNPKICAKQKFLPQSKKNLKTSNDSLLMSGPNQKKTSGSGEQERLFKNL